MQAAEPSPPPPPDPPAAETFSDVTLEDGAPKIDMNFGGSGDKTDLLGGDGWSGGWGGSKETSTWGFGATPLGGAKDASSGDPWGASDKKKQGDGFVIPNIDLVSVAEVNGIGDEEFQKIAEETKKTCPVSQVLAGAEISLKASLKNAAAAA